MAVNINFAAGEGFTVNNLGGNGLGWYGPDGFGSSVKIGFWGATCYITDSTGSTEGARVDCAVPTGTSTCTINGVAYPSLRHVPNYLSTLNIYLTSDTLVRTQNAKVRIFNRSDIDVPPVGVTCKVAEIIHPGTTADNTGTGSTTWKTLGGAGGTIGGVEYDPPLTLAASPGTNGASPDGSATEDTRHDWYLLIAQSPDANGPKLQNALWFSVEYL